MTQTTGNPPLLTLWYKPGATLQGLIRSQRGHGAAISFAALFGLLQAWALFRADTGAGAPVLFLGPLLAVGLLYLFAWLMRNFARWFGAETLQANLRRALGWGLLPWLLAFALLAWLGERTTDPAELAGLYPYFFALFLYGYMLLLLSLKAALKLSILKTFLCFVLTAMVSVFPLTLLAQLLLGPPPAA